MSSSSNDTTLAHLNQRIDNLEIKIAYMDDTIETLNRIVAEQQKTLQETTKQLKMLHTIVKQIEPDSGIEAFTPETNIPPHY